MRGRTIVILLACTAAAVALYLRQPGRTRIPDPLVPVTTVQAQFQKLDMRERALLAGYLLRQRGELQSLRQRDEGPLTARTFSDAIKLQAAFVEAHTYAPFSVVRIGLEDQALRPLRAVVELTGIEVTTTTRRQIFGIHPQASTRYGGPDAIAEEDKPLLKTVYFLRNRTGSDVEVTGLVEVRKARYPRNDLGSLTSCHFKRKEIAAHQTARVECSNASLNAGLSGPDQLLLDSGEADRHLIWTPQEIRFADGRTLVYHEDTAAKDRLWGFYALELVY